MIIGAGLAGLRTAAELRARSHPGRIILIGSEAHPPYDRPPLSAKLLSHPDPVWLAEDLSIDLAEVVDELHLGAQAVGLTLGEISTVHLDAGAQIPARNVVIATGSTPINPWPGTLTLHTLADAAQIRSSLAERSGRVVIIGAGWIGVELAHVLAGGGHTVTLLEAGSEPLGAHLGEAAAHLRGWLKRVDLRTDTPVTGVRVNEEQTTVTTPGGDITADVVITAVGVRPATEWLRDTPIPMDARGFIPVDAGCRVTTPAGRVWAVGDVAARVHPVFGQVLGGHWFAALRDPAAVAASISGTNLPEPTTPEIFSDQGPHHVEVLGALVGTETVLRGESEGGSWVLFHLRDDTLIGAVVANSPRDTSSIRRALSRPELPRVSAAELADTAIPLRQLLRR